MWICVCWVLVFHCMYFCLIHFLEFTLSRFVYDTMWLRVLFVSGCYNYPFPGNWPPLSISLVWLSVHIDFVVCCKCKLSTLSKWSSTQSSWCDPSCHYFAWYWTTMIETCMYTIACVFLCVYIYIYIYIYLSIVIKQSWDVYIYTYIYICVYLYIYIYIDIYVYVCMYICLSIT